MEIRKTVAFVIATMGLLTASARAGDGGMQQLFNELGVQGNVTGPGAYEGQTRNFYTGGSLFMRVPAKNYQIATFSPPTVRAGCGGIDLFTGGFSFINKEQFVAMLRNIGQVAIGQAFYLAIDSMSQMIGVNLKHLFDQTAKINSFNINSCEAGQALGSGIMGKWQDWDAYMDKSLSLFSNVASDYSEARYETNKKDEGQLNSSVNNYAANDPRVKDTITRGNITWNAMKRLPGLDDDTRELFMSLIGTVIFQADGDARAVSALPGTGLTLDKIMGEGGGDANTLFYVYRCDETDNCLNPTEQALNVKSFKGMVRDRLLAIANNVANETRGSSDDPGFVNSVSLPIYKLISVSTAINNAGLAETMINKYQDLIAAEYASAYIRYALTHLERALAAQAIRAPAVEGEKIAELQGRIKETKQEMYSMLSKAYQSQIASFNFAQEVMQMERHMVGNMPAGLLGNLAWARGQNG